MNFERPVIFYDKIFTHNFCDEIIKTYKNTQRGRGEVGRGYIKKIRDSYVTFDDNPNFIFKEVNALVNKANKEAGWNFQIDYPETFQFTEYQLNQYYHWHQDSHSKPYKNKPNLKLNDKIRKISVSICLTDKSEYSGGELLIDLRNKEDDPSDVRNIYSHECMNYKGSAAVFPSFTWHKVNPVISGTRFSAVLWYLGNPYV